MLLALSGILLLVKADGATHLDTVGVLLAAIAGIFWAGYIVLSSKVGEKVPGGSGLAAALVISAVVTTPTGIASVSGPPDVAGAGRRGRGRTCCRPPCRGRWRWRRCAGSRPGSSAS